MAEALRETGQDADALAWYGSFAEHSLYAIVYLAPSHLRRAEIHDRRGELDQALEHYRRFLSLWSNSDPELAPLVEQARVRVRTLRARAG